MFPHCKITEIFFMCDEFSKDFDDIITKHSITEGQTEIKRKYHRDGMMSDSEVMTIMILFHNSEHQMAKPRVKGVPLLPRQGEAIH